MRLLFAPSAVRIATSGARRPERAREDGERGEVDAGEIDADEEGDGDDRERI